MKTARLLAAAVALTASCAAFATPAETPLSTYLQLLGEGTWTEISFADLAGSAWNRAGTTLVFTLAGENTRHSDTQTFGVAPLTGVVFTGLDNLLTDPRSVTLAGPLAGVSFDSHSGNAAQRATAPNALGGHGGDYAIYRSAHGEYVFAYEDWDRNSVRGDYNDMVIGMTVAAVPEPATTALLLAGLAGVAVVARRRRG